MNVRYALPLLLLVLGSNVALARTRTCRAEEDGRELRWKCAIHHGCGERWGECVSPGDKAARAVKQLSQLASVDLGRGRIGWEFELSYPLTGYYSVDESRDVSSSGVLLAGVNLGLRRFIWFTRAAASTHYGVELGVTGQFLYGLNPGLGEIEARYNIDLPEPDDASLAALVVRPSVGLWLGPFGLHGFAEYRHIWAISSDRETPSRGTLSGGVAVSLAYNRAARQGGGQLTFRWAPFGATLENFSACASWSWGLFSLGLEVAHVALGDGSGALDRGVLFNMLAGIRFASGGG